MKLDVKSAYQLLPVHPEDRLLLGFEWQGSHYVDCMLPFGLRSAPKIFTAVADGIEWILHRRGGVRNIDHYLDDYITFGRPRSSECAEALSIITKTCDELGVPLATEKLEGPATCITFLGIEVNSAAGVLRLPQDKVKIMQEALWLWGHKKSCTRKELESLIGSLQHACWVMRPGRSFMHRMIDLLSVAKCPHHHVRLNHEFRADLWWWATFAAHWNGIALLPHLSPPTITVTSDASGQWGCGAWCQLQFE